MDTSSLYYTLMYASNELTVLKWNKEGYGPQQTRIMVVKFVMEQQPHLEECHSY
jgi:hypothetical protein